MALDSGQVTLNVDDFDARQPLHYGKFTIHDYHAQNRVLTVPEIFTYSSNIGAARDGARGRRRGPQGLPEQARPARPPAHRVAGERRAASCPKRWGELNTVTIAFGHGLSVAPLQAVMGDRRRWSTAAC